jgi:hypothetical protein
MEVTQISRLIKAIFVAEKSILYSEQQDILTDIHLVFTVNNHTLELNNYEISKLYIKILSDLTQEGTFWYSVV